MANLVLNGKSIDSIDDIAENFVEEDVLREFKSGSLAAWLEEYGYEDEFERVKSIKPTASNIRVLSGIIDALNLDDGVIAQAAERRAEHQRKEELASKVREEQQKREEEERRRKEVEERKRSKEEAELRERERQREDEAERLRRERERQQRQEREETQRLLNMDLEKVAEAKSPQEAFEIYKKAADAGNVHAAAYLARCYYDGKGTAVDKIEAVKWLRKAAEQNNPFAELQLAECYNMGTGVTKNDKEARRWCVKAAEHGNANAQYLLGDYYLESGYGPSEGLRLVRAAAEQGLLDAQIKMGYLLSKRPGDMYYVGQYNYEESVRWHCKACAQSMETQYPLLGSQFMLFIQSISEFYQNSGKGFPKDYGPSPLRVIRKEVKLGNADAQCALGFYYMLGNYVQRDNSTAITWIRNAADQGNFIAQEMMKALEDQPEQVSSEFWDHERLMEFMGCFSNYDSGLREWVKL